MKDAEQRAAFYGMDEQVKIFDNCLNKYDIQITFFKPFT